MKNANEVVYEMRHLQDSIADGGLRKRKPDGIVSWIKKCGVENTAKDDSVYKTDLLQRIHDAVRHRASTVPYPFPRNFSLPKKKEGRGIIYVLYWKETKSGCTWQGLAKICLSADNQVPGFEHIPEATTAQMCETACCNKRGPDKMEGKDKCGMFQFKQGIGCFHGKSKHDCQHWTDARQTSARGWFGGEVNSQGMENQLRSTRNSRFEEMLKSVRSIRKKMPQGREGPNGYGISIVSPAHYVAALEQSKLDKLKELNIDIQTVDIPDELEPDFHSSWFFRTIALPSSPYKKTLQLDSDTILCQSLDAQVTIYLSYA
jgi:hypothetical protein